MAAVEVKTQEKPKARESRRIAAKGNHAAALAARDADIDVAAIYPITPQVQIAEKITEMVANGELDAEVIHVESEHSAMSAVVAAAATGARVFTATSSQGLELMHEILYIASGLRQPVVMALATRALSAPINIWNDYGDAMGMRDTGWIIIFSENVQEVYDNLIQAYYIAEHPDVLLPTVVTLDGYILSHTVEPLELIPRDEVLSYAVKRPRGYRPVLDPDQPMTFGVLGAPNWYYEIKMQQIMAMREAPRVIEEAAREFEKRFGRSYGFIEEYMMDDAEVAIVSLGATASLVKAAVNRLREEGVKAGMVKIRVYRPFPADQLAKALENVAAVGVLDRAVSFGAPLEGPLFLDVASTLAVRGMVKPMASFVHGLGGRDIFVREVMEMFKKLQEMARSGRSETRTLFYGVRSRTKLH
ncbi:Pyruvate:ferredoxin oxidoreductase, alpha subunit [Pyrodictium delaneyi]|uniref:2-oxoacid oxidoreductase (ferredoxin) n=1 Tax=Pyrodictium delaneyi TaxID=1273541 RepID=A0A0P0N2R4_9CREN|nr:ferredoxin oxidoreductase [Pyrodictium delaneyi]ALL00318.1 Pyruvate:ferredoxin oxidoreductase, alpha subunit [Pyrodictium delaneyi]OWJ54466.1 ferredoxin oxidoreductase [Pyrodictium delaneyi]